MSRFPRTPSAIYADINRRYFNGALPSNVIFTWVEDMSEGELIDSRHEMAAVAADEQAIAAEVGWTIEINHALRSLPKALYMTLAHEMIHIKLPDAQHRSKEWNREVRRLQGLGLLLRVF